MHNSSTGDTSWLKPLSTTVDLQRGVRRKESKEKDTGYMFGWVCPVCGRVYSPFVQMCGACLPQSVVTNTTEVRIEK